MLAQLVEKHPDEVRIVFRHFPIPSHPLAVPTAQATEAAGLQGKFWEMHDLIFEKQAEWAQMTTEQIQPWLEEQAETLGLDVAQFKTDMASQAVVDKVQQAQDHGMQIQIPGTPMLLLNGQYYQGPRDLANLEAILQMFKLEDRQFTNCPPTVIDPEKEYFAEVQTEKGDFTVQLYADKAPKTVNSFVFLAQQGWFDDVTFHRVMPGFVAQTGDPSGTGFGGPGYAFEDEITDLTFDSAGVVGMANAGPGSNGSQFFITYQAVPDLDGKYTVFGKVIEGMENVEKLTERNPQQSPDLPPGDKILSVEIREQ